MRSWGLWGVWCRGLGVTVAAGALVACGDEGAGVARDVGVDGAGEQASDATLDSGPEHLADVGFDAALADASPSDVAAAMDLSDTHDAPPFQAEDTAGSDDVDAGPTDLGLGEDTEDAPDGDAGDPVDVSVDAQLPDTATDTGGDDAVTGDDIADEDTAEPPETVCRGTDPRFWRDLTGNGHDGAFFDVDDTVFWVGEGTVAAPYALELGGTAWPRIELPDSAALRLESGSVEFWLRAESGTFANKMVYNHRDSADFAGVVLVSQDNQWKGLGTHMDGRWATAFAAPGHQLGLWQHVVLTWEFSGVTTTLRIFVDGVPTGSGSVPGGIRYLAKGRAQIGGLSGGWGSFHGGMAIARIWGAALSEAEVRGLYNADAVARFGRVAVTGEVAAPTPALLAHFDATPCE